MLLALLLLFLPPTPTYLSEQKPETAEQDDDLCVKQVNKLSWLTLIPLIASLFINLNFGYLQVSTSSIDMRVFSIAFSLKSTYCVTMIIVKSGELSKWPY